ncbi:MAG: DUF58 domain-containing protein [Oscillospiraceae bacterium]|nr:DUF58 domain-containing protein [Oscillospiraceae bacterium]
MKRNRIIWFCLWVLSVIGISLKGGVVTYGFFMLLTLVPLFSLGYLLAVYWLFHIYQELEQRFVSVNEPVRYRFALVNEYPLQFVSIRVRFFSHFSVITDLDDETEYELRPNSRIEKETRLICKYRGEYEIGIKEIEIQDYFRLFRIRYKNKECIHAVVKPQLIRTETLGDIVLSDAVRASERSKSELDVLSREYVPGDDRRLINWSQSARTGALMTRLMTGADQQEIAVITDTLRSGLEQPEFLPAENKILETALAVSYYFSCRSIRAAEYHLGEEMYRLTVENTQRFEAFYNAMSDIRFSSLHTHERLYEAALQRQDLLDSSMAFLILSTWDAAADALLRVLEQNGMTVVLCYIGEGELPDVSGHRSCTLLCIAPDSDLTRGICL